MKETNLTTIQTMAANILAEADYNVTEDLGSEKAAIAVTMIYLNADSVSGFGQDYKGIVSIINSPTRIAIIKDGFHTYYRDNDGLCGYEDLETDVRSIVVILQAAYDRLNI